MKNFQIIILGIFVVFAVAAVLIFSGAFSGSRGSETLNREVVLWGTYGERIIHPILQDLKDKKNIKVVYSEHNPASFENDLISALASGVGPDMIFLPSDLILPERDKFFVIPFDSLPERTFRDSFLAGGEIFLDKDGAVGLPVVIDPLVMYWNRGLLSSAGIPNPPMFWSDFLSLPDKLTRRDSRNNILQSATAMGTYRNVNNAKEIISSLILQTGDPIISGQSSTPRVALGTVGDGASAVRFYGEFANPAKVTYSWNSALPSAQDQFIAGKLAIYFGLASEVSRIRARNPNLDFDVAVIPQIKDLSSKLTFGKVTGVAVLKSSASPESAFAAAYAIAFGDPAGLISTYLALPPARRDLISVGTKDPLQSVFFNSALISRAFLDPKPTETDIIFRDMVEGTTIGKATPSEAVGQAARLLVELIGKSSF